MTDIVERLRYVAKIKSNLDRDKELIGQAAAEIERLKEVFKEAEKMIYDSGFQLGEAQAEIERLREKVEILEAEIRVMRKLPGKIEELMDNTIDEARALDAENVRLRRDLATYSKDTEDTENRILDAEFKAHDAEAEIEHLRAVIVRAKDALLDGQSTQWVHDLLVAALLEPKP